MRYGRVNTNARLKTAHSQALWKLGICKHQSTQCFGKTHVKQHTIYMVAFFTDTLIICRSIMQKYLFEIFYTFFLLYHPLQRWYSKHAWREVWDSKLYYSTQRHFSRSTIRDISHCHYVMVQKFHLKRKGKQSIKNFSHCQTCHSETRRENSKLRRAKSRPMIGSLKNFPSICMIPLSKYVE